MQELLGPNPPPKYRLMDGLIHYKGRLLIGSGANLQEQLIKALHANPNGGHYWVQATYQRVKGLFYWKGLKKGVYNYVT